jgi:predicted enzyme related to lactoylglutathione lyase
VPNVTLGRCVLAVHDEDVAIAFYGGLGFEVLVDDTRDSGLRLVHVGSEGVAGPGLWLLRADRERSGPAAVLYTDDLEATLQVVDAHGGGLRRGPADDAGSRYAHVHDPSGNELILVELA